MRILHLADLHLGYRDIRQDDSLNLPNPRDALLERIADRLVANQENGLKTWQHLDLLLIAGDLFDSHNPLDILIHRTITALQRIQALGTTIVTLPGNHDEYTYSNSVYRRYAKTWPGYLVENHEIKAPESINVRGQRIYLISVAYNATKPGVKGVLGVFPPRKGDSLHICLLHGIPSHYPAARRGERCLVYDAVSLSQSGYDYIALGHLHQPMIVADIPENPPGSSIQYAGMTMPRDAQDLGCGNLLFVDTAVGHTPLVEWYPISEDFFKPEDGKLIFDRQLGYSAKEIEVLALQESTIGALALKCQRDLLLTKEPEQERRILTAFRLALELLEREKLGS